MRASYSLPVLALSLLLPVGGMAADTAAGVQYLPGGGTRMSYDQRVQLNSRWDLGYYLFQMQEFGAAAKEFEKIRAVLPKDASLLALIGSCYSMSGQWKQGEKALLEAKAQSPAANLPPMFAKVHALHTDGRPLGGDWLQRHDAPMTAWCRLASANLQLQPKGLGQRLKVY